MTHFVSALGTCGTITGTGRFLKSKNSKINVFGVSSKGDEYVPGV